LPKNLGCVSNINISPALEEFSRTKILAEVEKDLAAKNSSDITAMVRNLRTGLTEKAKVYSEQNRVHLRMDYVRDEKHPTLNFKKFETTETPVRGVLKIDKKAGDLRQERGFFCVLPPARGQPDSLPA